MLCRVSEVAIHIFIFFFNDTATTEIYTLSLHDALPIWVESSIADVEKGTVAVRYDEGRVSNEQLIEAIEEAGYRGRLRDCLVPRDRKSTRLNSSHANISYAVFCLKKKKLT